jgi:predicted transposase/invertase (TIGR01784 family)
MSETAGDYHKKYYNDAFIEIFSNVEFTRSLLEDLVGKRWTSLIDFSTMEVKPSLFLGMSDDKKESDLLLKFSLKNKTDLLIYVLLEFQSTYEKMFFRLWEYLLRIYKKQYEPDKGLSVVVPIVIYNGEGQWKENTDFLSYFNLVDDELRQYIPAFRYLLIDINKLDDEWLAGLKSAAGYFFLLDKTNLEDVEAAYKQIHRIFKELSYNAGQKVIILLKRYLAGLLNYQGIDKNHYLEYINNKEDKSMLMQSIQKIEKRSMEKGLEKGLEKGAHDAKLETAKKMLQRKYSIEEIAELTGLSIAEIKSLTIC